MMWNALVGEGYAGLEGKYLVVGTLVTLADVPREMMGIGELCWMTAHAVVDFPAHVPLRPRL